MEFRKIVDQGMGDVPVVKLALPLRELRLAPDRSRSERKPFRTEAVGANSNGPAHVDRAQNVAHIRSQRDDGAIDDDRPLSNTPLTWLPPFR